MHRQRIYRSTNAIHPKFVARVSCMHTTHLAVVLLIYKASSRLERHFCMWHVASTNQNHVPFCGLVVSLCHLILSHVIELESHVINFSLFCRYKPLIDTEVTKGVT